MHNIVFEGHNSNKCVHSSGGHVPTAYPHMIICTKSEFESSRPASFVINNLRTIPIYYGSARLHKMCGVCSRDEFRNAETKLQIFSFSSNRCSRNLDTILDLERWATTVWAIWNARHRYYFEQYIRFNFAPSHYRCFHGIANIGYLLFRPFLFPTCDVSLPV